MSYRAVPIRTRKAGDLGRQIETTAVAKGLGLIPVVGSFLSPLASPIVNAISDWFSAGEAGERFFHQVYLKKKATPMTRSSIRSLIFLRRKLMR
jgi:hypothetical protein